MQIPEIIYFNGEIHTLDVDDYIGEAVAVKEGRIIAVGSNTSVCDLRHTNTTLVDLEQKTMVPGLIDAHLHLFPLGINLSNVNCQLHSIEEVIKAIKKQAAEAENDQQWIIGWGFDESLFKEGRKPDKWDFQEVTNPVYITRYCMHEAVVNERALEIAGITRATTISNGIIEQTAAGEMTGRLMETAMTIVEEKLPAYTTGQMEKAIQLAQQQLLQKGITSVHDAGLGFFDDPFREFAMLSGMEESGALHIRIYVMILAEYFTAFLKKHGDFSSMQLKLGAMKLFADGTIGGKTAAMEHPYQDSTERGMLLYTDEEMEKLVRKAHDMKKQVAVHAIGDRALEQVLRMYEQVQAEKKQANIRHRVEHVIISNDRLLEKMKQLGVVAIPQPAMIHTTGDLHNGNVAGGAYHYMALRSFFECGLHPAGSSDSPVEDADPMLGMYAAMKRESVTGNVFNQEECISLKEALQMYTIHAAYAAFEEKDKGTIERGKLADFTVLPKGFIRFSAEQVKETKAEMTIIDGVIRYRKENGDR